MNHHLIQIMIAWLVPLAAAAQDESPCSQPPQLEPAFTDDFAADSRDDYQISGKEEAVRWEPGKLTLGEGAVLRREINAGSWVEMELQLEFPELTEDGQTSELRIWLDFDQEDDSFVLFKQTRVEGEIRSEILVNQVEGNWDRPTSESTAVQTLSISPPTDVFCRDLHHGKCRSALPAELTMC